MGGFVKCLQCVKAYELILLYNYLLSSSWWILNLSEYIMNTGKQHIACVVA